MLSSHWAQLKDGWFWGSMPKMNREITQLNKTVQNSKKLQVTIFPKLLFSSIIFYYHYCFIRLPLHYKCLRYIRSLIVNTCLPAWNDMIGWIADRQFDWSNVCENGIWLDDHWQCRYTSVLHNYHKHTLPEYCKLHKNSSVGSVCVWIQRRRDTFTVISRVLSITNCSSVTPAHFIEK